MKCKLFKNIRCNECDKIVSTPVPNDTIIRAWIECPECIKKKEVK